MRATLARLCLALFCGALAAAALRYPGGSWLHPQATGFSLAENFWCDLLRERAHNAAANRDSVVLASFGFAALAAALACYWLEISRLLPHGWAIWVRAVGVISALATAAVALLPSDRFPSAHAPAVLIAGGLGFWCGVVCAVHAVLSWRRMRGFALTSILLVVCAGLNLVLYVSVAYLHAENNRALPVMQKLASIGLVCWMLVGLATSARHPKP